MQACFLFDHRSQAHVWHRGPGENSPLSIRQFICRVYRREAWLPQPHADNCHYSLDTGTEDINALWYCYTVHIQRLRWAKNSFPLQLSILLDFLRKGPRSTARLDTPLTCVLRVPFDHFGQSPWFVSSTTYISIQWPRARIPPPWLNRRRRNNRKKTKQCSTMWLLSLCNSKGDEYGELARAAGMTFIPFPKVIGAHQLSPLLPLPFPARRKKIKCDGCEPTCSQCSMSGSQCTWLQTKDRAALSRQCVASTFYMPHV